MSMTEGWKVVQTKPRNKAPKASTSQQAAKASQSAVPNRIPSTTGDSSHVKAVDAAGINKKFLAGQNKTTKSVGMPNAWKIEEDTGDYRVDRVSLDFCKALQKARMDKKLTQSQLAQLINEKVSVINDYENGKAIPNGKIVDKLNKALQSRLPSTKPK